MSLSIELPWPDKFLSPNARVHWAVKSKLFSIAKFEAWAIVRNAMHGQVAADPTERVKLRFTFHPPVNRKRDMDNLIASLKATQDGIAAGLDVNDSLFDSTYQIGEKRKPACVVVEIEYQPLPFAEVTP